MNRTESYSSNIHTLTDGRTLAYTCSGASDGTPVVVHHGTPGSRLFAGPLSDVAATEGVRLITPDRPGYGRSSTPPSDWTWWDWQSDLTELLDSMSIDRAALLGFSGGGPFAIAAATSEWASRLGLVSTVIPPAETGLATLSKVPFAVRLLFWVSSVIATVAGPETVVQQYTDRTVSATIAQAVAEDFDEALRQDTRAVARECRAFAANTLDSKRVSIPVHAWHGTEDANTPLAPVQAFMNSTGGPLEITEADHLGTLLDHREDTFRWLDSG
ncbi:alpha/beta hydrolase [Haloplanus salilacus]|uniref:alpha/beta fold hydrolase n=1 Tax=Haloplanus salilacus TaxID=2949994 RepID=UPI0030CB40E9